MLCADANGSYASFRVRTLLSMSQVTIVPVSPYLWYATFVSVYWSTSAIDNSIPAATTLRVYQQVLSLLGRYSCKLYLRTS